MNSKDILSLLGRVIVTFSGCIGLLQMDMMFWFYYWSSPLHGMNWIDVWWGDTPILLISDYNCWIIFQLCVWAVLIYIWIKYFIDKWQEIKALFKKFWNKLKNVARFVYHKVYK